MRCVKFFMMFLAIVSIGSIASGQAVWDDFESYDVGQIHDKGSWEGWEGAVAAGAPVSTAQAYSGTKSIDIVPAADLVRVFDVSGGKWVLKIRQYIPSGATGTSSLILLNQYPNSLDWSVQTSFNFDTGAITSYYDADASANITYDQWVEVKAIIDLDLNTVEEYYNGELFATHDWDDNNHTTFQAIDLFADGASSIYYDNLEVHTYASYVISLNSADDPSPANGSDDALRINGTLAWKPGPFAATHNVYLGTSYEDVESATAPTATVDVNSFDPGRLEFSQIYYWRVDEVNDAPDRTVFKGDIWSFTAEPYAIQILAADVNVTGSSASNEFSSPATTTDGSGLDENGVHATEPETMWFTQMADPDPWIQYEFNAVKKLDTMKVWNSNSAAEAFLGYGVKGVEIAYSTDGETWDVLADANEFNRAPGLATYDQPDTIDFGGVAAKMVRLNIQSNWGDVMPSYSLSEVQFNVIPAAARMPVPASDSTGTAPEAVLSWRAGREAAQSIVYLSADPNEVANGSAASATSNTNSISLGAFDTQLGQLYYWRVDEVNEAEAISTWAGPVWSLTVADAVVVDDFEDYTNDSPDRPFQAWIDGFGFSADEFFPAGHSGNGTGAGVGHDIWSVSSPYYNGDIMETAGSQSLPFYYNNAGSGAQIDRTFAVSQDWTAGNVTTLVLWLRGSLSNPTAGQLYVKINNTKVMYDGDLVIPIWQQWNIDLAASGANVTNVTSLSIGVEGNGSGLVYLDNIKLYRIAPPVVGPPAGGDKSLVAHWTLDETEGLIAADSSGYGNDGTLVDMTGTEWATGLQGNALEFSGSNQVHIETSGSLQLSGSVTISAWVKMNAGNAGAYLGIAGKLRPSPYRGFSLVRHSSNVFRLWVDDGKGVIAGFDASSDTTYTDTEWHHVAGVVDDGTSSLYIDGVKQAAEGSVDLTDSGQHAHIGIQYSEYTDRYWKGLIDDVRIYYRALSAQEISGL